MPSRYLLYKLRHPDTTNPQSLLLHVSPKSSSASDRLKLDVWATEGENAYLLKLKQKNLATYRQAEFKGSDEELEALLLWALAKKQPTNVALVAGVDVVAAVMREEVVVTVRRDGAGVAELHLPVTEEEISIYEWAECAVDARDRAIAESKEYRAKMETQTRVIESLTAQLDTMTRLKKDHEKVLLSKFKGLLDSKKRKIRELNRELASARDTAPAVQSDTDMPDPDPPARTRRAKGKAPAAFPPVAKPRPTRKRKPAAVESDSDSDGGFVSAKTEQPKTNTRVGKKAKSPTPDDGTDDATEEEDEGPQMSDSRESEDELPPPRRPIGFGAAEKEKEKEKEKEPYDAAGTAGDAGEETEDDEL